MLKEDPKIRKRAQNKRREGCDKIRKEGSRNVVRRQEGEEALENEERRNKMQPDCDGCGRRSEADWALLITAEPCACLIRDETRNPRSRA
jgi:hypothetical protein